MMVLIQSLCTGKVGLSKSDILTFTALLKSAQTPPGSAVSGNIFCQRIRVIIAIPLINWSQGKVGKMKT